MSCCEPATHENLKASGLRNFLAATVYLGVQDFGEKFPRLALANCPRCHSTLGYVLGCCEKPEDVQG